jgi:Ca-activated chloride channel family protein
MKTADFPADRDTRKITRLDAAKTTFTKFVAGRTDDLVGLVVFANYPDLVCPPTLDHRFLVDAVAAVRVARPGDDGTNIGDAIALALDSLRKTTPSKKVLVLLTDGNNEPAVPRPLDPVKAAELARDLGVTLHTIAIGRPGGVVRDTDADSKAPIVTEVQGPNIPLLERLAKITGGRSFVAADADALGEVFKTIDALEKSEVRSEIRTRYNEHFARWAILALGFLCVDRLLVSGKLRKLP